MGSQWKKQGAGGREQGVTGKKKIKGDGKKRKEMKWERK
jgi:hypothetical protein